MLVYIPKGQAPAIQEVLSTKLRAWDMKPQMSSMLA